jgi:hypothetical protein
MNQITQSFKSNANQTGIMTFDRIREGTNPADKNVYIYKRTLENGNVFAYEVFIPSVKKAGEYPLPNGKTIVYADDFEEYPGASKFGHSAFCCKNLDRANAHFEGMMLDPNLEVVPSDDADSDDKPTIINRRAYGKKTVLSLPTTEFSTQVLADFNKVEYYVAANFLREQKADNKIKLVRSQRIGTSKRPTNFYIGQS